ncbi:MAG: hypothetical protein KME08_00105 [Aphanothece sp. CMT-3BRIN-NPC111]|nr:hypothetical protein [Aphanothece sp. CMT-3BRIN-NPC111]
MKRFRRSQSVAAALQLKLRTAASLPLHEGGKTVYQLMPTRFDRYGAPLPKCELVYLTVSLVGLQGV